MADTDQPREDIAATADAAAAPASAPAEPTGGDEFDRAITDFQVATSKPASPALDDLFQPSPENVDRLLQHEASAADTVRHANELDALQGRGLAAELRASQLEQALAQIQQRQWLEKERADFSDFIKEAEKNIGDLPLPEGFAERWLIAEAIKNDKLAAWWDNRHHPDARTRATINNYLRDTLRRLDKEARSVPDVQVTADVAAVVQSMRGASTNKVAPDPPPNLGRMTDGEFQKYKAQFGF